MTTDVFNQYAEEYDLWFDKHTFAYQSEIEAIKKFIPGKGEGVEVGTGTGRFSIPFGIKTGVEPSERMADIARSREIDVRIAHAEKLPFDHEQFDFVLIATTLCFVSDPELALNESGRILKPNGRIIVAIIDRESPLGKTYEAMKISNKFYKDAVFYSAKDIINLLEQTNFGNIKICQTIFTNPDKMTAPEIVKSGYGEGAFVVLSAIKLN
jgi:ubiquinone/menaquinone biosynthesis C-methylase UbiE